MDEEDEEQLSTRCIVSVLFHLLCVCVHSLGEVGELPPPSVEEVEGGLASTGRGTGRAIGGGGGGGSMGVGRKGLWTFPWELPLGWGGGVINRSVTTCNLSAVCVCVCINRFPQRS